MNEVDREIILILKETFRLKKKGELLEPDYLLEELVIKGSLILSLFCLLAWGILAFFGHDSASNMRFAAGGPISAFFCFLFFHLNSQSKNPSMIMFALTWVSFMFGLYF